MLHQLNPFLAGNLTKTKSTYANEMPRLNFALSALLSFHKVLEGHAIFNGHLLPMEAEWYHKTTFSAKTALG